MKWGTRKKQWSVYDIVNASSKKCKQTKGKYKIGDLWDSILWFQVLSSISRAVLCLYLKKTHSQKMTEYAWKLWNCEILMAEGFDLAANEGFELQTWAVFWQWPSCAFRKSRVWILCVNNNTVIPAPSSSFLFQLHPHGQNCCKEQEISQWVIEVSLVCPSLTCSSERSWSCCGHWCCQDPCCWRKQKSLHSIGAWSCSWGLGLRGILEAPHFLLGI